MVAYRSPSNPGWVVNRNLLTHGLWIAASMAILTGLLMSAMTLHGLEERSARRSQRRGYLEELARLADQLAPYQEAYDACRHAGKARPLSPEALLAGVDGAPVADDVRRETRELGGGWQAARKTFVFNKTQVGLIMAFVEKAEAAEPPWNLVRCDIRALSREAALAAVTVELETLQRPPN